jgi:hypothetical protein
MLFAGGIKRLVFLLVWIWSYFMLVELGKMD